MPSDFIRDIIDEDNRTGKHGGRVLTRFPPEPNGYLHIGHAKSICLNFGIAAQYGSRCNLRFDDTNPEAEEVEYVDSIQQDVEWLGFSFGDRALYASDYFGEMYELAEDLIRAGDAYVDHLNDEDIKKFRGSLTEAGTPSPYRDRSADENLTWFRRMRSGELADGECVLRARIDLAAANMKMRDPLLYRIRHFHHHRTGDQWPIYPLYDYAHPISDAIEGITHSICTLEFENNRELYDWVVAHTGVSERHGFSRPQQIEFARLNLTYTMLSKRKLLQLVNEGTVNGWDDPRMPTISGYRRKGYTPESIRAFCRHIGVNKFNSTVDIGVLENFLREDLNKRAPRRMAVLRPLKVVITNYPEGQVDHLDAVNNPEDAAAGTRKVPFARVLYIEQDDFRESPPPKYFRLYPGNEVRLRYAYYVKCTGVVKDAGGNVTEVHCTYDPATRGGDSPDGRKVKSTIHWVAADSAVTAEVRLYEHLFTKADPEDVPEGKDWKANLNHNSLEVIPDAKLEPSLRDVAAGEKFQFERLGYFSVDPDSVRGRPVFNRSVSLKDTWAKEAQKGARP